jgi:hypothetical protein
VIVLNRKKTGGTERGVALIISLLVLLLITAVGMGMIMMSNTETNVSANFRDEQTAYFAAKGGIEEVRDRLRSNATNSLSATIPTTALPGTPSGILYVINPLGGETVAPWLLAGSNYPDDELAKELNCTSTAPTGAWWVPVSPTASTAYQTSPILPWKWVRVMEKINKSDTGCTRITSVDGTTNGNRVCWTGTNEIATALASCPAAGNTYLPVYELTALAVTSSGSRRMTQYEVSRTSLPPIPGAIVFDGATPDFGTNPHSAAFNVTGTDQHTGPNAGVGCPAASNEPGLGGYNAAAATSLTTQTNRPGSYTGSPAGIADVSSQLGPLATVDGLNNLVNSVTTMAGSNVYGASPLPSPSGINLGTNAAPVINVVQGDYTLPGSGSGILLVTGTLTMSGTPSFNGLILVIGKGNVVKNGGGNGTLDGSLLVANMYTNTSYTTPIALGSNNPPGIPTIAWNGGGNATIQYDSCWINSLSQSLPYKIVTQRELSY